MAVLTGRDHSDFHVCERSVLSGGTTHWLVVTHAISDSPCSPSSTPVQESTSKESYLLNGHALNSGRAAQGMPTRVTPAGIACLDFNLQKTKTHMGIQVLVSKSRELEKIRQRGQRRHANSKKAVTWR